MKDHKKSGVEPCRSAEAVGKAGDDGQGALVERLRALALNHAPMQRATAEWQAADRIEALTRENAALRADNERLRTFAHEATKAITGLTAGGSEYFGGEVDGIYLADLPLCGERIRERFATPRQKAAEAKVERLERERDEARQHARVSRLESTKYRSRAEAAERQGQAQGEAQRIADVIAEESANGAACGWKACSGCHETNEGYETGRYPYSALFGCHVGFGCNECGGLGAVWEYWDKASLDEMVRDVATPPSPEPDAELVAALQDVEHWLATGDAQGINHLKRIREALHRKQEGA